MNFQQLGCADGDDHVFTFYFKKVIEASKPCILGLHHLIIFQGLVSRPRTFNQRIATIEFRAQQRTWEFFQMNLRGEEMPRFLPKKV